MNCKVRRDFRSIISVRKSLFIIKTARGGCVCSDARSSAGWSTAKNSANRTQGKMSGRANGVRPLQKGTAPSRLCQSAGFADAPTSVLKTKPPLRLAFADTRRCRPDEISETEKGSLSFHVLTMYQCAIWPTAENARLLLPALSGTVQLLREYQKHCGRY